MWNKGVVKTTVTDSIRSDIVLGEKKRLNSLRMLSYRRAQLSAQELLAREILMIPVDGQMTVDDIMKKHQYSRQQFAHLLTDRLITRRYPLDFYMTRCNAYVTFADIIRVLPYRYPSRDFPRFDDAAHATVYTSLVVDTRGTEFTPLLMPSIYDEGGLELYGRQYIDPDKMHDSGLVLYVTSEDEAMNHELAGEHPYYTVALRTLSGSPVISYRDVRRLFSREDNIDYLKKCRVFFITDGSTM